jgi:Bacterial antitoxin of ParD toxin-antitoxin type II system and RHH
MIAVSEKKRGFKAGGKEPILIMQTMNISLPEPLKEFVDAQIAAGRYSSVSEFLRVFTQAASHNRLFRAD